MKKKILIGSIIAVALLLLMPSIPAIQHKVVKDKILIEITKNLDLEDLREDIINAISENNWKEKFNLMLFLIFILCLGFAGIYASNIEYNKVNDLYPILTKLYAIIFCIPTCFCLVIAILIMIYFELIGYYNYPDI